MKLTIELDTSTLTRRQWDRIGELLELPDVPASEGGPSPEDFKPGGTDGADDRVVEDWQVPVMRRDVRLMEGDRVWCAAWGEGVVKDVESVERDNTSIDFHAGGLGRAYNNDGRYYLTLSTAYDITRINNRPIIED